MKRPQLSIIVLSYNTKNLLKDCLKSLEDKKKEVSFEVIVSDNGSEDSSVDMVKRDFKWVKLIENKKNLGFAGGNNSAKNACRGKYILFLNSDTIVKKNTLKKTVEYLKKNKDVGALTCKIVLPNGDLDKDARRSFPTPWVSLTHLVLRLDKLFPKSTLFAKYWYGYISENETHEVDVLQGAYLLTHKKILDEVGWFDKDYFLDGEDVDICWKIKSKGWKIIYYPKVGIIHVKGASKGKNEAKKQVPFSERLKFRMSGIDSMEIFYRKRLWRKYPLAVNLAVLSGIKLLKAGRLVKLIILG